MIPFEEVFGCAEEEPEVVQAAHGEGSREKRNIGTWAKSLREAWISFLQREEDEGEEEESKKDKKSMEGKEHKLRKKKKHTSMSHVMKQINKANNNLMKLQGVHGGVCDGQQSVTCRTLTLPHAIAIHTLFELPPGAIYHHIFGGPSQISAEVV